MSGLDITDRIGMFMEALHQTKPTLIVYNSVLCRGNKNQVYIYLYDRRYRSPLVCWGMFYGHKWDSPWWIPHKHALPLPGLLSFQPARNETNRPALSEMHSLSAYLGALQCIMFKFYSEQRCDTSCSRDKASCLYAECTNWWFAAQDNWLLIYFLFFPFYDREAHIKFIH